MSVERGDPPLVSVVARMVSGGCFGLATGLVAFGVALVVGRRVPVRDEVWGFVVPALAVSLYGLLEVLLLELLVVRRGGNEVGPPPAERREVTGAGAVALLTLRSWRAMTVPLWVVGAVIVGTWVAGLVAGAGAALLVGAAQARLWEKRTGMVMLIDTRGGRHGRFLRPT